MTMMLTGQQDLKTMDATGKSVLQGDDKGAPPFLQLLSQLAAGIQSSKSSGQLHDGQPIQQDDETALRQADQLLAEWLLSAMTEAELHGWLAQLADLLASSPPEGTEDGGIEQLIAIIDQLTNR